MLYGYYYELLYIKLGFMDVILEKTSEADEEFVRKGFYDSFNENFGINVIQGQLEY